MVIFTVFYDRWLHLTFGICLEIKKKRQKANAYQKSGFGYFTLYCPRKLYILPSESIFYQNRSKN